MEEKEYEHKWQYVMHTERMQAGFIQWYLTVCAATFVFLYSNESAALTPLINDRWLALVVLSLYSVLTCLRLLAQKKNYHAYTVRIRELEGNKGDNKSPRAKAFSVFKLQYYVICLVGGLVAAILVSELSSCFALSAGLGFMSSGILISLSFTKLIGE